MENLNNNCELNSNEIETFAKKLKNNQYISTYLYKIVENEEPNIIPKNFDLNIYNEKIIESEYQKNKEYFDNMYKEIDPNIHLDKEQIKAIISDEDYSLILAGAGSGKTTTMASKVKYLVDIKKIDPSKILVMSYTKKATEELEKRIVLDFEIPAKVTTFHSLGLMHIREIFKNHKCYVVDDNTKYEIFLEYFKKYIFPYKSKIKEILEIFDNNIVSKEWMFGTYFKEHYELYSTFEEYFEAYKNHRLKEINDKKIWITEKIEKDLNSEIIKTIKGELVKSKGEAQIANFLFTNGIEYKYEKIYEKLMTDNKIYKPDFTLNLNGDNIYLEYFGLSTYKENELNRYNKIKKMKEDYHKANNNKFIKIDYQSNENIITSLKEQLINFGFKLKEISEEKIIDTILNNNQLSQLYPFKDFMYQIIEIIKSSKKRSTFHKEVVSYLNKLPSNLKNINKKQYTYIIEFYKFYQSKLFDSDDYGFDYSDMIYYANLYIHTINNNKLCFDYLIIDEYQDISEERYQLTKQISVRNTAKIVAVGDDWQTIFSFAGSKIKYIYNFLQYFPGSKLFKITNTYRNSQQLVDYSSKFIMKNESQIKKELVSNKKLDDPIKYILFEENEEYHVLKQLILDIHNRNKNHNILILGRTNKIIEMCYDDPQLKDGIGTKIQYVGYEDIDIDGMTFHKSKGLTADEVILIGLNNRFPREQNQYFWLEYILKDDFQKEKIQYAEERRLFYVALTRTKNYVYLLVNKNPNYRSKFINEIYNISHDNEKEGD